MERCSCVLACGEGAILSIIILLMLTCAFLGFNLVLQFLNKISPGPEYFLPGGAWSFVYLQVAFFHHRINTEECSSLPHKPLQRIPAWKALLLLCLGGSSLIGSSYIWLTCTCLIHDTFESCPKTS